MDPSGAKGLSRHKMVLRNFYIEPKDEEITVTFLYITNEPVREAKPSQPRREVDKRKYIFCVYLFSRNMDFVHVP